MDNKEQISTYDQYEVVDKKVSDINPEASETTENVAILESQLLRMQLITCMPLDENRNVPEEKQDESKEESEVIKSENEEFQLLSEEKEEEPTSDLCSDIDTWPIEGDDFLYSIDNGVYPDTEEDYDDSTATGGFRIFEDQMEEEDYDDDCYN